MSILGLFLRAALKDWASYPTVSMTFHKNLYLLWSLIKLGLSVGLCKGNQYKLSLPASGSVKKDDDSKANWLQGLTLFIPSVNALGFGFIHVVLAWAVTESPSREKSWSCWGPVTVKNMGASGYGKDEWVSLVSHHNWGANSLIIYQRWH